MPASSRKSISILLALSFVWGSSWIANEILREQAGPLHLAMLRYGLAGLFASLVYGCRLLLRRPRLWPKHKGQQGRPSDGANLLLCPTTTKADVAVITDLRWLRTSLLLGITLFAAPDLLLVWAAQHGAAAWTPMIYAGLPLGLTLAAGELRMPAALGIGAMLSVLNGSLPLTAAKLPWVLPIMMAVALQGWSLIHAQRHLVAASSLGSLTVQFVTGAICLQAGLWLWPEPSMIQPLYHWSAASIGALCLLAGLATAAAYPLYYRLLRELSPAQLGTSEWLQTLVAVGESAVLLHQRPGWAMAGAAGMLLACTVLMLRREDNSVPLVTLSPSR